MNREIKFRAWDRIINKMTQLNLLGIELDGDLTVYTVTCNEKGNVCQSKKDKIPVMQYTGLKDRNGVEIYEGDIVEHYGLIYAVEWDRYGVWMLKGLNHRAMPDGSDQKIGDEMLCNEWKEIEVIGNIYENPELLEDK